MSARSIDRIVVHCTATRPHATTEAIMNGFWARSWTAPGYHYLISADGAEVALWPEAKVANGARGFNRHSVHVAYVGGIGADGRPADTRTPAQRRALRALLQRLRERYPQAGIMGHYDLSPDQNQNGVVDPWERIKECPCFDAQTEYAGL